MIWKLYAWNKSSDSCPCAFLFFENYGQLSRACDSSPTVLLPWGRQNTQYLWLRWTAGLKKRPVSTSNLCEESKNLQSSLRRPKRQVAWQTSAIPKDVWVESTKGYFLNGLHRVPTTINTLHWMVPLFIQLHSDHGCRQINFMSFSGLLMALQTTCHSHSRQSTNQKN